MPLLGWLALAGIGGYLLLSSKSASAATQPGGAPSSPGGGGGTSVPPYDLLGGGPVNPSGGQVYDPNLGGGGLVNPSSGMLPGYQGEYTAPQTQAGIPGLDTPSDGPLPDSATTTSGVAGIDPFTGRRYM